MTVDAFALHYDEQYGMYHRSADAILSHPRFPDARAAYLRAILDLYGEDRFLNKLLLEAARQIVSGGLICLLAAWDEADRATWPTLANLKRLLRPFRQSSDRRIEQLVLRLVSVGFLEQRTSDRDARVRLLIPTGMMLAHDQDWLMAHYRPLALLYPDDDHALPLRRDQAFQLGQRRVSFGFIPRSSVVLLSNAPILLFARRDAGFLVLAQIITDQLAERPTSFDALSRRFAISRTHVRQLLRDAEGLGLLRVSGRGGQRITLLAPMWAALDRFVADGMSGHDLTGRLAARAANNAAPGMNSPQAMPVVTRV